MNRRHFLKQGLKIGTWALAGSGLVLSADRYLNDRTVRAANGAAKRELPIPAVLEFDGDRPIELSMQAGRWEILPGIKTPTVGFNGPYLGPTIRVRQGQDVPLVYRNNLSEPIAVHGHGLHVPGEADGGPQQLIAPGETWAPVLPIRQQAGTCWYHPHTHGHTGRQVYHGLAGFFIIDDENSQALPLPGTYGLDDLPVVIQDRTLDAGGRLVYSLEEADEDDGFLAETITVNGITDPMAVVPAGLVRLRLLNGSNARFYRFRFSDGRKFHKIATDGGFLESPVSISEMVMLPGERNEIVVDFSDGRPARLVSGPSPSRNASNDDDDDGGGNWRNWGPGGMGDDFDILTFQVDPGLPAMRGDLPGQMNRIHRPTVQNDWPRRRFEMSMEDMDNDDDGGRRMAMGHEMVMSMMINGKTMDMNVINERVQRGQWERWSIRAEDGSHPFHIHGCSFLVLSQEGRPVTEEHAGWKDTVWVEDRAEIMVRFEYMATDRYPYMYHCHILEHEDRGMMGQFTVG